MFSWIQSMDEAIQLFIQSNWHPAKALETVMAFITTLGDAGIFWIALGLVLLLFKKTRKAGACMLAVLAVEFILGEGILKALVKRPRPYTVFPEITMYVDKLSSYSFPSGHSMSSFACAATLVRFHRPWGIAALVFATLMAFSRVYLFMHWPSDVLCGALLGILVSLVVMKVIRLVAKRLKEKHCEAAA